MTIAVFFVSIISLIVFWGSLPIALNSYFDYTHAKIFLKKELVGLYKKPCIISGIIAGIAFTIFIVGVIIVV